MKLEQLSLGFAAMVIASAFALEGGSQQLDQELPVVANLDARTPIAVSNVAAPVLEPVAVVGRTVARLEQADGGELGTTLDAAWQGHRIQKSWNWQIVWTSDRCLADPDLNPACKQLDERGEERLQALLAELDHAVQDTQKALHEELQSCKQRKIAAGTFDLVPAGQRIPSNPRALSSSFLGLPDGQTRHVQLFPHEFRSLDAALARRDESRALRRKRVCDWIRAQ